MFSVRFLELYDLMHFYGFVYVTFIFFYNAEMSRLEDFHKI